MLEHIFNDILQKTGNRVVSKPLKNGIYLDKNEQPLDIDPSFKQLVLDELGKCDWNRYPPASNEQLEQLIAKYARLTPDNIAVAPGSASIITALLNYFAINQKHIVIAQPSYTLFDYHCKTYSINYQPWYLSNELEYDLGTLPQLTEKSVLIIASPNNPVGNIITHDQLETILQHKNSPLVILDSVYLEFSDIDLNPLICKYDNLIVLRSFSKAFPAAGMRLGYACSNNSVTAMLRKLILLFSINHFSRVFASVLLGNPEMILKIENRIMALKTERDYLYLKLLELSRDKQLLVKRSEGNFLLLQIPDTQKYQLLLKILEEKNIHILSTANLKMLENSIRVSVGTNDENKIFLNYVKNVLV